MFCTSCGKEVEPGKTFCTNCGATLSAGPAEPADQTTEPTLVVAAQQPVLSAQQPVAPPQAAALVRPAEPTPGQGPAVSAAGPPPPRRRYGLYAFIAGLVLVICAGAGVATYLLLRDDGAASSATPTTAEATTIIIGVDVTAGPGATAGPGGVLELVDLSTRATGIDASSVLESQGEVDYEVQNLLDKKPATCWAEGVAGYGVGEYVEFTWAAPVDIYQVRIVPGYDKTADGWDRWTSNGRVRTFELVFSDGTTEWFAVSDSRAMQSLDLTTTHTVTSVRFVITGVFEALPGPHKAEDTSVSELHLWGTE